MAGPGRLVLLYSLLFSFFLPALSKLVSRTIDDGYENSEPTLNHTIRFLPAKNGHWGDASAGCPTKEPPFKFCLPVDPANAFAQTWTATGLYQTGIRRSIEIEFIGSKIDVFLTLVDSGPSNFSTRCTFTVDDETPKTYEHIPPREELPLAFTYRQPAFTRDGLVHGPHKLLISVAPSNYLNFDYAEYSFDDELILQSATSSAPQQTASAAGYSDPSAAGNSKSGESNSGESQGVLKAAIIGGSISGTIVVVAIIAFILYRCRRRGSRDQSDRLTFGVPSTYAGSTRKLSLPFWPHKPAEDEGASNFQNITPFPEKRNSVKSYASSQYSEKYEPDYPSQTAQTRDRRDRRSVDTQGGLLSPANALMQSFFSTPTTRSSKRGSHATSKLSRLEDSFSPASSSFPRNLSRFSDVRVKQATDTGVTISSSNVLPLQTPTSSAGRQTPGGFYAV